MRRRDSEYVDSLTNLTVMYMNRNYIALRCFNIFNQHIFNNKVCFDDVRDNFIVLASWFTDLLEQQIEYYSRSLVWTWKSHFVESKIVA